MQGVTQSPEAPTDGIGTISLDVQSAIATITQAFLEGRNAAKVNPPSTANSKGDEGIVESHNENDMAANKEQNSPKSDEINVDNPLATSNEIGTRDSYPK